MKPVFASILIQIIITILSTNSIFIFILTCSQVSPTTINLAKSTTAAATAADYYLNQRLLKRINSFEDLDFWMQEHYLILGPFLI